MACRLGVRPLTKILSPVTLRHTHSLDAGLQKMWPKYTRAAGELWVKSTLWKVGGGNQPGVKHIYKEEKAWEQFLCTRTALCTFLSAPKWNCFYGNQNSVTSVHFYTVSSHQSMCFSLACGSKNIIEIQLQFWSSFFLLSQNYLLQNGPDWGLSPHEPYKQGKMHRIKW